MIKVGVNGKHQVYHVANLYCSSLIKSKPIRSGQNHLARHRKKGEEDKADGGRSGKTISGNGQAWIEFAKSQRAVENRGKWRKLVVKLPVVPQRPSRLRDR